MSFLLQRIVFRISDAAKNWTIVKNKFLVPVKPKRPLAAYMLFSNEQRSSQSGSIIEVATKLGAEWKKMTPEQKQKYFDEAKKLAKQHEVKLAEYESKYVEPFKNINSTSLAIKSLYKNFAEKPKGIIQGAQKLKEYFKNRSEEQKKKFKDEALKMKEENLKIQAPFLIPEAQFKTEKAFIDHTLRDKNQGPFSSLSENQQLEVKKEYEKYIEKHKKSLESFAKKHGLTLAELTKIIKLHQRRLRKDELSEHTVNYLAEPEKVKPLRVRRRAASSTKETLVRKTATRTKVTKSIAKKKTAAKKTAATKATAKNAAGRKVAKKN